MTVGQPRSPERSKRLSDQVADERVDFHRLHRSVTSIRTATEDHLIPACRQHEPVVSKRTIAEPP